MSDLTVLIGVTVALVISVLRLTWLIKKQPPKTAAYKVRLARYIFVVFALLGITIFLAVHLFIQS